MEYEAVIGLEIHAEVDTKSKMFCSCKNDPFNSLPNENICPVCVGLPGAMPVANKTAVEAVIKAGLALNCENCKFSKWDRKNYFYPDLPKGYQISQYDLPLTKGGYLEIEGKKIGITRVHLEEDTGKLMHPKGENYSLVDYNRSGVPLMELVTEPAIRSGGEARQFGQELQLILRRLNISKADMEKGEMRVEVNISLRTKGAEKFGTKVEIKNLNSFRAVERAINFEIERQTTLLKNGGKIIQETRGWDEDKGKSFSQREKETSMDYRYFPEPDLPPVETEEKYISKIQEEMPELPREQRERYMKQFGLMEEVSQILVNQEELGKYFDNLMKFEKVDAKVAAKWLVQEDVNLEINYKNFAKLLSLIDQGVISGTIGKEVLKIMGETKKEPEEIIEKEGFRQIAGGEELRNAIYEVIEENGKAVEDYRRGKEAALGFIVGQVMRKTKGQANPQILNKMVEELIKN